MSDSWKASMGWTCPVDIPIEGRVVLAHGEGGRRSRELLHGMILKRLERVSICDLDDATRIESALEDWCVTTDSYVVSPWSFPGGNIGSLAVYGTVNDLAVRGAVPRWITLGLILEEGFELKDLAGVLDSIARAASECNVRIAAGDTKVVPRGACDGIFINTTGIGTFEAVVPAGPGSLKVGDALLVSGPFAQHGIAIMAAREELQLTPPPESDTRSLIDLTYALRRKLGHDLRSMRDATRGGVAAVLFEWCLASGQSIEIDEAKIPITSAARGVCELLGLDPLFVANEGVMVAAVDSERSHEALQILRSFEAGKEAVILGQVTERKASDVVIRRPLGVLHPLREPQGALLPRIC